MSARLDDRSNLSTETERSIYATRHIFSRRVATSLGEVRRITLPRTPVHRGRLFTGAGYTYFIKNDAIYLVLVLS